MPKSSHIAGKDHTCPVCGELIPKGSRYRSYNGRKLHSECKIRVRDAEEILGSVGFLEGLYNLHTDQYSGTHTFSRAW